MYNLLHFCLLSIVFLKLRMTRPFLSFITQIKKQMIFDFALLCSVMCSAVFETLFCHHYVFLFHRWFYLTLMYDTLKKLSASPAGNCMFKVNNRNTRTRCEICSKCLVSLLLTLNIFHTLF